MKCSLPGRISLSDLRLGPRSFRTRGFKMEKLAMSPLKAQNSPGLPSRGEFQRKEIIEAGRENWELFPQSLPWLASFEGEPKKRSGITASHLP